MKKTHKKIENALVKTLTRVCETALIKVDGFQWLTHQVNYNNFPQSLIITCVFDTKDELSNAINSQQDGYLYQLIQKEFEIGDIHFKDIKKHVKLDSEEACQEQHSGKWQERLK